MSSLNRGYPTLHVRVVFVKTIGEVIRLVDEAQGAIFKVLFETPLNEVWRETWILETL